MKKLLVGVFTIVTATLIACGGGGGGSTTVSTSVPTTYSAALSIGDQGSLTIDTTRTPITYKLTIENSSYGLAGSSISGQLTDNGDGTYNVVGSSYTKVFKYDNYAVVPVQVNSPQVGGNIYVPVFALNKTSLLKTVDDLTSSGSVTSMRSVHYGFVTSNGSKQYSSYGGKGTLTKISDSSFSLQMCTNGGSSINNSNLSTCSNSALNKTMTLNYDESAGGWLVQQPHGSTVKVIANFVKDSIEGQVIGYVDTSDSTGQSAGFSVVTISNVPFHHVSQATTGSLVSYELCSNSGNCAVGPNGESGIAVSLNVPIANASNITRNDQGGCTFTTTDDDPVSGFGTYIYSGAGVGTGCGTAGHFPDGIAIMFGQTVQGGVARGLRASAGYDTSLSPASSNFKIMAVEAR